MVNGRTLFFLLFACLLLVALQAQEARPAMEGPVPAQGGEICVVCYGPVLAGDLVYLIRGRRYAVDRFEQAQFLEDPQRYVDRFDQYQSSQRRKSLFAFGIGLVLFTLGAGIFLLRRRRSSGK